MKSTEFHLFRIKVERPTLPFGERSIPSSEVVSSAIQERPSYRMPGRALWRIGNVEHCGTEGLFFALGKVSKTTHGMYDEKLGDFIEESLEDATHTYVAIDLEYQVCAIGYKRKVAGKVKYIADSLARLLGTSTIAVEGALTFSLSELSDADEFLQLIKSAVRISSFEMSFSPPNPFDVDGQFHRPMEKLLQASAAARGRTAIFGEALESETIETLARSAASTGNTAKARIQSQEDTTPILRSISDNPLIVTAREYITSDEKKNLIASIRRAYLRIRGSE